MTILTAKSTLAEVKTVDFTKIEPLANDNFNNTNREIWQAAKLAIGRYIWCESHEYRDVYQGNFRVLSVISSEFKITEGEAANKLIKEGTIQRPIWCSTDDFWLEDQHNTYVEII